MKDTFVYMVSDLRNGDVYNVYEAFEDAFLEVSKTLECESITAKQDLPEIRKTALERMQKELRREYHPVMVALYADEFSHLELWMVPVR